LGEGVMIMLVGGCGLGGEIGWRGVIGLMI